jgi:gluconolactonase
LTPGKAPELVRTTIGGNGTTFDLQGRLVVCEGDDRRLTRMTADGKEESLVDNYQGRRFNRPNNVVCHSNGCHYFTDPDKRRPYRDREIPGPEGDSNLWDGARVYRLAPDGGLSVLAHCEYPNGLALSPDERIMYVANTRSSQYIHAIKLDAAGNMVGRSIFADLNEGSEPGIPDGLKVDSVGTGLLHRTGRHLGDCARRQTLGYHRVAGASRKFCLRRT